MSKQQKKRLRQQIKNLKKEKEKKEKEDKKGPQKVLNYEKCDFPIPY